MYKTRLTLSLALLLFSSALWSAAPAQERGYSAYHDYRVAPVVDGLVRPWSLAFLPGGDLLIILTTARKDALLPTIISRCQLVRFDILDETPAGKNGELQITDALLRQAREGCVIAYKLDGKRFDCGSIDGFVEATNYCYKLKYGESA